MTSSPTSALTLSRSATSGIAPFFFSQQVLYRRQKVLWNDYQARSSNCQYLRYRADACVMPRTLDVGQRLLCQTMLPCDVVLGQPGTNACLRHLRPNRLQKLLHVRFMLKAQWLTFKTPPAIVELQRIHNFPHFDGARPTG